MSFTKKIRRYLSLTLITIQLLENLLLPIAYLPEPLVPFRDLVHRVNLVGQSLGKLSKIIAPSLTHACTWVVTDCGSGCADNKDLYSCNRNPANDYVAPGTTGTNTASDAKAAAVAPANIVDQITGQTTGASGSPTADVYNDPYYTATGCDGTAAGATATRSTDNCTYKCEGNGNWSLVSCPSGSVSDYPPTAGLDRPPTGDQTACDINPDSQACVKQQEQEVGKACSNAAYGGEATNTTDKCTYKCTGKDATGVDTWDLVSCPEGQVSIYGPTAGLSAPPPSDKTACDVAPDSGACQQFKTSHPACSPGVEYGDTAVRDTDGCTYICQGAGADWRLESCPAGSVSDYPPTLGWDKPKYATSGGGGGPELPTPLDLSQDKCTKWVCTNPSDTSTCTPAPDTPGFWCPNSKVCLPANTQFTCSEYEFQNAAPVDWNNANEAANDKHNCPEGTQWIEAPAEWGGPGCYTQDVADRLCKPPRVLSDGTCINPPVRQGDTLTPEQLAAEEAAAAQSAASANCTGSTATCSGKPCGTVATDSAPTQGVACEDLHDASCPNTAVCTVVCQSNGLWKTLGCTGTDRFIYHDDGTREYYAPNGNISNLCGDGTCNFGENYTICPHDCKEGVTGGDSTQVTSTGAEDDPNYVELPISGTGLSEFLAAASTICNNDLACMQETTVENQNQPATSLLANAKNQLITQITGCSLADTLLTSCPPYQGHERTDPYKDFSVVQLSQIADYKNLAQNECGRQGENSTPSQITTCVDGWLAQIFAGTVFDPEALAQNTHTLIRSNTIAQILESCPPPNTPHSFIFDAQNHTLGMGFSQDRTRVLGVITPPPPSICSAATLQNLNDQDLEKASIVANICALDENCNHDTLFSNQNQTQLLATYKDLLITSICGTGATCQNQHQNDTIAELEKFKLQQTQANVDAILNVFITALGIGKDGSLSPQEIKAAAFQECLKDVTCQIAYAAAVTGKSEADIKAEITRLGKEAFGLEVTDWQTLQDQGWLNTLFYLVTNPNNQSRQEDIASLRTQLRNNINTYCQLQNAFNFNNTSDRLSLYVRCDIELSQVLKDQGALELQTSINQQIEDLQNQAIEALTADQYAADLLSCETSHRPESCVAQANRDHQKTLTDLQAYPLENLLEVYLSYTQNRAEAVSFLSLNGFLDQAREDCRKAGSACDPDNVHDVFAHAQDLFQKTLIPPPSPPSTALETLCNAAESIVAYRTADNGWNNPKLNCGAWGCNTTTNTCNSPLSSPSGLPPGMVTNHSFGGYSCFLSSSTNSEGQIIETVDPRSEARSCANAIALSLANTADNSSLPAQAVSSYCQTHTCINNQLPQTLSDQDYQDFVTLSRYLATFSPEDSQNAENVIQTQIETTFKTGSQKEIRDLGQRLGFTDDELNLVLRELRTGGTHSSDYNRIISQGAHRQLLLTLNEDSQQIFSLTTANTPEYITQRFTNQSLWAGWQAYRNAYGQDISFEEYQIEINSRAAQASIDPQYVINLDARTWAKNVCLSTSTTYVNLDSSLAPPACRSLCEDIDHQQCNQINTISSQTFAAGLNELRCGDPTSPSLTGALDLNLSCDTGAQWALTQLGTVNTLTQYGFTPNAAANTVAFGSDLKSIKDQVDAFAGPVVSGLVDFGTTTYAAALPAGFFEVIGQIDNHPGIGGAWAAAVSVGYSHGQTLAGENLFPFQMSLVPGLIVVPTCVNPSCIAESLAAISDSVGLTSTARHDVQAFAQGQTKGISPLSRYVLPAADTLAIFAGVFNQSFSTAPYVNPRAQEQMARQQAVNQIEQLGLTTPEGAPLSAANYDQWAPEQQEALQIIADKYLETLPSQEEANRQTALSNLMGFGFLGMGTILRGTNTALLGGVKTAVNAGRISETTGKLIASVGQGVISSAPLVLIGYNAVSEGITQINELKTSHAAVITEIDQNITDPQLKAQLLAGLQAQNAQIEQRAMEDFAFTLIQQVAFVGRHIYTTATNAANQARYQKLVEEGEFAPVRDAAERANSPEITPELIKDAYDRAKIDTEGSTDPLAWRTRAAEILADQLGLPREVVRNGRIQIPEGTALHYEVDGQRGRTLAESGYNLFFLEISGDPGSPLINLRIQSPQGITRALVPLDVSAPIILATADTVSSLYQNTTLADWQSRQTQTQTTTSTKAIDFARLTQNLVVLKEGATVQFSSQGVDYAFSGQSWRNLEIDIVDAQGNLLRTLKIKGSIDASLSELNLIETTGNQLRLSFANGEITFTDPALTREFVAQLQGPTAVTLSVADPAVANNPGYGLTLPEKIGFNLLRVVSGIVNAPNTLAHSIADSLTTIELAFARENGFFGFVRNRLAGRPAPETALQPLPAGIQQHAQDAADVMAKIATAKSGGAKTPEQIRDQAQPGDMVIIKLEYAGEASTRELPATAGQETSPKVVYEVIQLVPGDPAKNVAETTPTSTETALADALAVERPTTYTLYLYKASDAAMSRQADVALQLALSRIETMSPEETLNFLKTIPLALRTFYVPEPGTRELPGGTIPTDPSQLALLPTARTFTYPGQTQAPMYEPAADGSITIAPNATILTPSPVIIPPGTTHIQIDSNTYLLSQQPIKPGTPFSVGTLSIFGYIPQIFFPDGIPSGSLSSASGPQPNPAISPTQITILGFLSFSLPLPEIFFKFLNGLGNRLAGTPTQIPLAAAPAAPITQEIPPPPAVPEIPTVPPTTPAETTQAPQKTAVKIPVPAKESPSTVAQTISSIVAATQERAQTEVVASVPSVSPEINDAIAQATGNLTPDQVNANKELARALFFYVTVDNALRRAQTAAKSFSDKIEDGQVALLNPDALAEEFIRQAPISLIGNWRGTVQRSAASYTVDTADREQATAVYEQTLNRQISLIAEAQKQSFFEIASERQQAVNNLTQTIKRVVNLLPTISQGIDPQSETASIIRSIAGALDEKFIGTDPTQENLTRALSIIEQGAADIASLTQGKTASEINEIYQNEQLQADIADLTIIASLQPQPPATPIFPTLLPAGSQPTIARLPAPPPLVSQITELGQLIPSGPVIALPAALVIDIATTTEIGQIITNALRSNPLIANLLPPLPTQQEVETLSPEEIDNAVSAVVEADLALRKQARQEELTAALRSRQQTVVEQQETAAVAAERQARIRALIDQNQQILEAEADTTPEEKAATRQAAIDSYLAQTPTAEITSYFASTKEASDYYHQLFAQLETEITARQAQVEAARQAQLDALARGRTTQARQRAALATLYVGIEAAFGRLTASVLENALEYQQLQAQQAATLDAMAAALALQQARAATIAAFQIAQEELETVLTDNRLSTAQTTAILNRSVSGQNATVEQLLSLTAINLDNFDPETIDGLTIALSDITERVTTAAAAAAFLAETLPFTPTPSLPNRLTPEIAQAIAEKALATTTPQRRGYLTKLRQDITSRTEATLEAEAEIARRQATAAFLAEAGSVVITPLSPALSRVTLATALNIAEGLLRLRSPERAQELADLRAAIETRNSEAIPLPAPKQPTLFPTPTLPKLPTAKQPAIPLPAPAVEERTRQAEAEAALPAAPEELPIPQIQTPSEKIAQAVINLFTTPINPIPTTIFRNTVRHNFTKLFTDELQLLTQEQVEQQVNRSVLLGPLRYFILDTTESISVSLDYIIHPTPQISRIKGIINLLMLPLTTVINPVGGFASETANYAVTPILTPTNLIGLALSVYGLAYPLPQFAADPPLYLTLFFIMRILIPLPTIYFLHVPPISLITFWFRAIHETTHRLNQGILPVNPAIFPTYKLGNEAITDYFALRSTDNPSNLLEKISRAITIAGMYIYSRYNHYTNIQTLIELLAQKSGLTFTQVEKLLATSYLSIPGSENSFNDFITNLLGPDTATQLLDVINEQVGSSTASKLMEELILAPTEEQTPATPAPPDTEAVPTTIEEPTLPPAPTLPKVAIPTTTEPPSPEITATRLNLALSLLTGIPSFLTDIFSTTLSALAARIPQRINLSPLQEQITKITSATSQTLSSLPFPKLILPLALSLVIFTNTSFTSFVPPSQISEALAPPAPPAITQTIPTQPEFIQPQAPSSIETPPAAITTPPAPAT